MFVPARVPMFLTAKERRQERKAEQRTGEERNLEVSPLPPTPPQTSNDVRVLSLSHYDFGNESEQISVLRLAFTSSSCHTCAEVNINGSTVKHLTGVRAALQT